MKIVSEISSVFIQVSSLVSRSLHLDIGEQVCQRDSIWVGDLIHATLLDCLCTLHFAGHSANGHLISTRLAHRHRVSLSWQSTLQALVNIVVGERLLDVKRSVRPIHALDRSCCSSSHGVPRVRITHRATHTRACKLCVS